MMTCNCEITFAAVKGKPLHGAMPDEILETARYVQLCDLHMAIVSFRLGMIRECVNQQVEDEGLWFEAETAPEAYLQQELRRLHNVVEADHRLEQGVVGIPDPEKQH